MQVFLHPFSVLDDSLLLFSVVVFVVSSIKYDGSEMETVFWLNVNELTINAITNMPAIKLKMDLVFI